MCSSSSVFPCCYIGILLMCRGEVGEGRAAIVLVLGLCLLGSLCLWTIDFTRTSQVFLPLQWDRMGKVGCSQVTPFPLCRLGSEKPSKLGLAVPPEAGLTKIRGLLRF